MIALVIGYEVNSRLFASVLIHFSEAITMAIRGSIVIVAGVRLLSGRHHHSHHDDVEDSHAHHDQSMDRDNDMGASTTNVIADAGGSVLVTDGVALARPRFWM